MKYIDAEKLIAEIERLKEEYNKSIPVNVPNDRMEATKALVCMGKVEVLNQALCVLHSLQQEQPEVDLEKELNQWRHKHFKGKRDGDYCGEYLERESQFDLARHFWNKGYNARKEE